MYNIFKDNRKYKRKDGGCKMRRLISISIVMLLGLTLLMTGCTTVQKGAAGGGLVGAAIGGTWGASSGGALNAGEGAAIGAAAGGLIGALLADGMGEGDSDLQAQIDNLEKELAAKQAEIDRLNALLADKDRQIADLQSEIDRLKSQSSNTPYTITVLDGLLFDPGKAVIKQSGKAVLDEVVKYIEQNFPNRKMVIQGHTDSDPIKASNWKSNWELGAARALAILHYINANSSIPAEAMSAETCGEYKPVATNGTSEGKQQNRRCVFVIMPAAAVEETHVNTAN